MPLKDIYYKCDGCGELRSETVAVTKEAKLLCPGCAIEPAPLTVIMYLTAEQDEGDMIVDAESEPTPEPEPKADPE